ncbi:PIR Superfamily Protein [Plasmodium ovale wallikeri]|uniref:PIR Superfamily Protein n=1 Tax=Plasmodium ovale wallikeri TaxID=864142 RepID=A0A1A8YPP3_PLAOA|nr:PIR Superfamily Protein [Plasmodium ovale wallikeri]SBT33564.1 PIR Superfamily Protein [Plasmodium ovale wallikeri]
MVTPENELPSKINDITLAKGVNYNILKSFIESNKIQQIKIWFSKFENNFRHYVRSQLQSWPKNNSDKRCRDVNYILDVINEKIKGIKKYKFDLDLHKMNSTAKFILFNHPNLKCSRNGYVNMGNKHKYIKKLLDNLCEDINYIRTNIDEIKGKHVCKSMMTKITTNKDRLNEQLTSDIDRTNEIFKIGDDCTIDKIGSMIDSITCNGESEEFSSTVRAGAERVSENEEFGEEAGAEEIQQYLSESESSSSIKSSSIGLSLSGIVATGVLLYRTTPLGTWVNTNILKRSSIDSLDTHTSEDIVMNNFDPIHSSLNHDYDIPYHLVSNA